MITPMIPSLKRAYAEGPSGQVHYYDAGGSGRPIILVHQSPTSAIDYAEVAPLFLRSGFRVLALDLPGMGMSDAPSWIPTIPDFVDALMAVLDHAEIRLADAVGHHTGAVVLTAAAERFPDRLGRLVLYGVPYMSSEALSGLWNQIVPAEKASGLFTPDDQGTHLSDLFQRLAPRYGAAATNRMVLSRMLAGDRLWYGHNAALTWDMRPSLHAIAHPMLFITHEGEMLDGYTRSAAAAIAGAQMATLEGRFAVALDSAPEAFARVAAAFVLRPLERAAGHPQEAAT
jgi:pimeloyl-ACP methyl ester carboxylesterase